MTNEIGTGYTLVRPSLIELQYPLKGHGLMTLRVELDQPFAPHVFKDLESLMRDLETLAEHWPLMGETEDGTPVIWSEGYDEEPEPEGVVHVVYES